MTQATKNDVLERMLRFMVDKRASDLYLSANSPPIIRINGLCVPITSQPLGVQAPRELLAQRIGEVGPRARRPLPEWLADLGDGDLLLEHRDRLAGGG